ncbi:hypothetical protein [Caldisericum exile]|uniref:Uncharacterized protein n=1 Tax=Caldisericum exile (strain DSM 21853 / NBRC 104410 / AZM16c01) TaxID=511051 RepID=A0A7U6GDG9_CALEA|nr:hypothetical protein [Caldisericum exile]BAL80402.1 hypothetical protein CSE_02760 [Caldisericum exile AZM16c01]
MSKKNLTNELKDWLLSNYTYDSSFYDRLYKDEVKDEEMNYFVTIMLQTHLMQLYNLVAILKDYGVGNAELINEIKNRLDGK